MKSLLYVLIFLIVFGVSLYFFLMNSQQSVSVNLWSGMKTPELPVGLVVLLSFFIGFLFGFLAFPLTFIIKRLG